MLLQVFQEEGVQHMEINAPKAVLAVSSSGNAVILYRILQAPVQVPHGATGAAAEPIRLQLQRLQEFHGHEESIEDIELLSDDRT